MLIFVRQFFLSDFSPNPLTNQTLCTMAPKKKSSEACANTDDDTLLCATRAQWLADNAKANEINAKILAGLLAPALLYLQNLDSFKDWDAPQPLQLKTKDEKSQGHLGAYMAPFDKKSVLAVTREQWQVHLRCPITVSEPPVQPHSKG